MYIKFQELLESKERNRKKKKYFPDFYLARNYLENAANDLAYKHFTNTISEIEIKMMSIATGWSVDFWLIRGYSHEDAKSKVAARQSGHGKAKIAKYSKEELRTQSHRCVEYWEKIGFSEEDAKLKVAELQTTFSLEKCIKEHGEILGIKIWEDRQLKWQNTLNNKSKEDKSEINLKKNVFNLNNLIRIHGNELGQIKYKENMTRASLLSTMSPSSKSKRSILFFDKLEEKVYREFGIVVNSKYGITGEYSIKRNNLNRIFLYDYTIEDLKIIIEYHGRMWHPKEGQYDFISPVGDTYEIVFNRDQEKKQLAISSGFMFFEYFSGTNMHDTLDFLNVVSLEIKNRYENYKNKIIESVQII